ncbi:hypothetical protein ACFL60_00720 [Candidatus Omnitrophota bacterium]
MHKRTIPIIHIIGLPGAGKTTLAERLGKTLKIPVFCIGGYRTRFPQTAIGEADAWMALFQELSRCGWKNCILETTGLNSREAFLKAALPFEQMFTIKLEASRKTLELRIRKKKKEDRGGEWFYSAKYRNKYEFARKFFKSFCRIPANCYINTNRLTKAAVNRRAFIEIDSMGSEGL